MMKLLSQLFLLGTSASVSRELQRVIVNLRVALITFVCLMVMLMITLVIAAAYLIVQLTQIVQ